MKLWKYFRKCKKCHQWWYHTLIVHYWYHLYHLWDPHQWDNRVNITPLFDKFMYIMKTCFLIRILYLLTGTICDGWGGAVCECRILPSRGIRTCTVCITIPYMTHIHHRWPASLCSIASSQSFHDIETLFKRRSFLPITVYCSQKLYLW